MTRALLVGLAILAAAGCAEEAQKAADVQKMGQAMGQAVVQAGSNLAAGSQVEPVDFRELKALLPESVAGLKRVNAEGSRTNVMGIGSSKAVARYEDGKGARIEIEILDIGTFTGVASLAFAWVHVEIDKEGDDGYERTATLGGRKAYERYSKSGRTGELDVIVAARFVVAVRGSGIDMKAFRQAVERLDLKKLEALKDRGLPPAETTAKGK
jgi:hypothetical protein